MPGLQIQVEGSPSPSFLLYSLCDPGHSAQEVMGMTSQIWTSDKQQITF